MQYDVGRCRSNEMASAMLLGCVLVSPQPSHSNARFPRVLSCIKSSSSSSDSRQAQVKVGVGPVGNLVEQAFPITRKLGPSSNIVVVTLPKPLGIVFELSKTATGRIFVAELIPNGNADRAARVNQLFESQKGRESSHGKVMYGGRVKVGDLLLATTTVNVVVDLFGLRAPRRVILLFDVDGRTWAETMGAIQSSFVADGPVTLILERESCYK